MSTPRLAAVHAWRAAGRTGPVAWPAKRWPDPPEWADYDVRIAAAVRMCASGAPAELGHPPTTDPTSQPATVPPSRRRWPWPTRKAQP